MSASGVPQPPLPSTGANAGTGRGKPYTRGVCTECSRRHHKCDAVHPECTPCKISCLTCAYPEKKRGPKLYDEFARLEALVGALMSKIDAQQTDIANMRGTVEALAQAAGISVQTPLLHPGQHQHQHQHLNPLRIPLTPVSSGPPSSFPSSAESSPHPGLHALPAQHGAHLGVPPSDHAFSRGHTRTASGMSSSSDGSSQYDGGTTHLDVPRRRVRTLSNTSSSSDRSFQYEPYIGSQSSSPYTPALFLESAPGWPGPAGFPGFGDPSAPGYGDVPVTMNVTETEPGRSGPQEMFNNNMWGIASGSSGAGLGPHMTGNTWGNPAEDMEMGEAALND